MFVKDGKRIGLAAHFSDAMSMMRRGRMGDGKSIPWRTVAVSVTSGRPLGRMAYGGELPKENGELNA